MSNKTVIGRVPRGLTPDLARFLADMREQVQIQGGKGRGDELDRAVTYRDLKKYAGITDLSALRDLLASDDSSDTEFFGDAFPTIPTGVEVLPTFTSILVKWDRVPSEWYKATEVFRVITLLNTDDPDNHFPYLDEGRTPVFTDAVQVSTTIAPFFTDEVPPGTTAVYWVRHLNRDNEAGPVHAAYGTYGTTKRTPLEVLQEYSDEIYQSDAYGWLRSELGEVDALYRGMMGAGFENGMGNLLARGVDVDALLAEQALKASLDSHTQRNEIKAQFGKNFARLTSGIHAAVNADEAYVQRITTLESKWENDLGPLIDSRMDTIETSLSSPEGAIASKLDNYEVNYNGSNIKLQTLAATVADNESNHARWGVKTDVNGKRGGVVFDNDGFMTNFLVDADTFAVTNGATDVLPFVIKNGKTVIKTALIDSAEIFDLISENITAKNIVATSTFTSPVINGGEINGTTLSIIGTGGKRMTVDAQGFLEAEGAEFKSIVIRDSANKVIMSSSGLADTYIETLFGVDATFKGTVYAKNLEGDVMDSIVKVTSPVLVYRGLRGSAFLSFKVAALPVNLGFARVVNIGTVFVTSECGIYSNGGGAALVLYLNGNWVAQTNFTIPANTSETDLAVITRGITPPLYVLPEDTSGTFELRLEVFSSTEASARIGAHNVLIQSFKQGSTLS